MLPRRVQARAGEPGFKPLTSCTAKLEPAVPTAFFGNLSLFIERIMGSCKGEVPSPEPGRGRASEHCQPESPPRTLHCVTSPTHRATSAQDPRQHRLMTVTTSVHSFLWARHHAFLCQLIRTPETLLSKHYSLSATKSHTSCTSDGWPGQGSDTHDGVQRPLCQPHITARTC